MAAVPLIRPLQCEALTVHQRGRRPPPHRRRLPQVPTEPPVVRMGPQRRLPLPLPCRLQCPAQLTAPMQERVPRHPRRFPEPIRLSPVTRQLRYRAPMGLLPVVKGQRPMPPQVEIRIPHNRAAFQHSPVQFPVNPEKGLLARTAPVRSRVNLVRSISSFPN